MFSDAEFEEACASLENPNFEGWEFFVESKGVTIYRNYRESSGLYEYKVIGTMEGVTPDVCAKVYVDLDYRKQWDSYVSELREITEDEKTGIYWNVNYPFPLSNRDFLGQTFFPTYMHYYDNPKGLIPTWLINWAAKTGVPAFLDSMTKACMGYKEYQEKKITQH
ncbi:Phosphatidylcholine transfer protein [Holothuria leucospilota]|uniref:Phosphatidylcholine transfer protein n=1 Tax=Holothuria leucospilota TaxID=206669 RepID=A0A9Q1C117_HOLLE|nr:Phosphatidylcholine transfer protein [Holothuria leucospilota]